MYFVNGILYLDFLGTAIIVFSKRIETRIPNIYVMDVVYVIDNVGTPIRELTVKENALALHKEFGSWMYIDMV